MQKIAVVFFGTPGGGKGMQADLAVDKYGLVHLDTGKLLRSILTDPSGRKDPVIARERKLNEAGILNTPRWVLKVLTERVHVISRSGYGVIFSGSPRTLFEAEGFMPILEKEYGKKNIFIFHLKVPPAVAARRNADRVVCAFCRRPLLTAYYPTRNPKNCPVCGGKLERRKDDNPEKYKTRYREYVNRTAPVMQFLKKRGYKVRDVDGTPAPYLVFQKIAKHLPR